MFRVKMKLEVGLSVWIALAIAIATGASLAICVTQWQNGVVYMWSGTAIQVENSVRHVVEDHLNHSQFVAQFVPLNSTPTTLLQYFRQFDENEAFRFTSMGYLTNRTLPPVMDKLSWQIAKYYPACPYLGYFYADATTYPGFFGYCANTTFINFANASYSGFDWGMKPEEYNLVNGLLNITFLPIFNLLGSFTLTCEIARLPYVSFAELDLNTLTTYFSSGISILKGAGNAYIVETASGAMIASTINGTVVSKGDRLFAFNSTSDAIRETFNLTQQSSKWLISSFRTTRPGLDWTTYTIILRSDVYGNLYYTVMVAGLVCMGVALLMIGLSVIGVYLWVTVFIRKHKNKQLGYTPFDNLNELNT
jgi:hypothetical protein